MTAMSVMLATNLARTTSISRTGAVKSTSRVPVFRSSATRRIAMMGTMSRKRADIWKKIWARLATLFTNRMLVKV